MKKNQTFQPAGPSEGDPQGETGKIREQFTGVVDRVTFHNPDSGWSILRVLPLDVRGSRATVVVHQTKVFAGATMAFEGTWTVHPKYGRQFKAFKAVEKKPASASALEKYLGSGLIKGVGPKTAKKIVRHFKGKTLEVFEQDIQRLTEVAGIAGKKLAMISSAWTEHRAIRDVMMFLQSHGISTLFAVRIYKEYGDEAIARVTRDPYCLADDFYGIGFFSADKVALSIGFAKDSPGRIMAGIRHVLSAARNFGHCFLTLSQIRTQVKEILDLDPGEGLAGILESMETDRLLMKRILDLGKGGEQACFYAKSLYFDEAYVAGRIRDMGPTPDIDLLRVQRWVSLFCKTKNLDLSPEQAQAVQGIVGQRFSVLTGGPGCGKTTATRVLVRLIEAMGLKVLLAAPTGRAAQRMGEVIGKPAKTIHRLLGWQGTRFKRDEKTPLDMDFLVVDECSMLDISLTASLLRAVPLNSQAVFIGDYDQLPSVGAGNVLKDLISSGKVACFRLTKIFRQAAQSLIIKYAHEINEGKMPWIKSPFEDPEIWKGKIDCLFIDSDEATQEQLRFVARVKSAGNDPGPSQAPKELFEFRVGEPGSPYETEAQIPRKFAHVDLDRLLASETRVDELKAVLKKVHPWSSLHYGLTAVDAVKKLYLDWIPKYRGREREIQILSPMTRGTLGTINLNRVIQEAANPPGEGKAQIQAGHRIFRKGDRVIHRKNNYNLGVFNGDIGIITEISAMDLTCTVSFFPYGRQVVYQQSDIMELDLAYAVTIHKSQGSEFEAVIIPILTQHFKMLFRNLIYTGITRARKLAVFVGTRRALGMAVANKDISRRQTALKELITQT
ncbi:SF1B family DNA helicase RecD2 [Desulfospira joergensenii]|uniref:SF1B family DNA helicase RecD2 n=1 Tax=Desulfospira joergensenii TaxID=53329 RepID=UPI0003B5DCB3|nr:AAA family ATPase [Desulfospira joergensenii]